MPSDFHWFKGNLHMHSFWSDGADFPEVIAHWFKTHGYHFIAFTEHDQFQVGEKWISTHPTQRSGRILRESGSRSRYEEVFGKDWVERREGPNGTEIRLKPLAEYRSRVEESGKFLILNGEEVTVTWRAGKHWINVCNAPQPLPPVNARGSSASAVRHLVAAANQLAALSGRTILVSFNHPNYLWNATADEIAKATGLRFMEIHTALNCCNSYGDNEHPGAEHIWDIVLAERLRKSPGAMVFGLASDDCHFYHPRVTDRDHAGTSSHPGRAWVMVRAPQLTSQAVLNALSAGNFYCSTGVTLESVEAAAGMLRVRIAPMDGARFTTRFIGAPRHRESTGEVGITLKETEGSQATYAFRGDELYVRALVISDRPHPNPTVPGDVMKAWTQPVKGTK